MHRYLILLNMSLKWYWIMLVIVSKYHAYKKVTSILSYLSVFAFKEKKTEWDFFVVLNQHFCGWTFFEVCYKFVAQPSIFLCSSLYQGQIEDINIAVCWNIYYLNQVVQTLNRSDLTARVAPSWSVLVIFLCCFLHNTLWTYYMYVGNTVDWIL